MALQLEKSVFELDQAKYLTIDGLCSHPAGHCWGNDGGTGMPEALKVPAGRGGQDVVSELDENGISYVSSDTYQRCQLCLKYMKV